MALPKSSPPIRFNALRERREELSRQEGQRLTQEDIASRSGDAVSQRTVSHLEAGAIELGSLAATRLAALARALKWTLADLQEATGVDLGIVVPSKESSDSLSPNQTVGQKFNRRVSDAGPMVSVDTTLVPMYGTATASSPAFFLSEANIMNYVVIPHEVSRNGNTFAVSISGNSMFPTIEDGDTVLIDKSATDLEDGKMFLILIEGQGVCVKRTRLLNGQWWLFSDNTVHTPFQAEDAVVLGRAYHKQPRGSDL